MRRLLAVAAMKLLATVLSPMGLEKVNEIREPTMISRQMDRSGVPEDVAVGPRWAHRGRSERSPSVIGGPVGSGGTDGPGLQSGD
jgi:hypothetical protein